MRTALRRGIAAGVVAVIALIFSHTAQAQGRPPIAWMSGGHSSGIHSLSITPDGQTLASASYDGSAKLWRASDSALLRTLTGHSVAAFGVALSPDGSKVATTGYEGTVKVWATDSGALESTLTGHVGAVYTVAFSPDGATIASGGDDGTVRLWATADGSLLGTLTGHTGRVYCVAFSPDGLAVASASEDGTARVRRVSDGVTLATLTGHVGPVLSVAYSPSGDRVLTASTDDTTGVWRTSDWSFVGAITGQTLYTYRAVFSPDGSTIASGAGDGTVAISRTSDLGLERTIVTPTGVHGLAYSPDGATLYVAGEDGMIARWSPADGSMLGAVTTHLGPVLSVAVSPDGSTAAAASADNTISLHSMVDGSQTGSLVGHDDWVQTIAFSPDGALLASGSSAYDVFVWDVASRSHVRTLSGHSDSVLAVAFSPDGSMLASGSADTTIRLWSVSDGSLLGVLVGHLGAVNALSFSPDGLVLASGSSDGTVKAWGMLDQSLLWTSAAEPSSVAAVAFSPDGAEVAAGYVANASGALKVWSSGDGAVVHTPAIAEPMRTVSYSPDGLLVITGGNSGESGRLRFWAAENMALLQTYDDETGNGPARQGVLSTAWAPSGTQVLYGRCDGVTVLMDNPFWPLPTTVSVAPQGVQIGEIVDLSATLTSTLGGGGVTGKTLGFSVAGTGVGTGVTNDAGVATCTYRIPEALGLGDRTVDVTWAGDAAYAEGSGSGVLTVTRANTGLAVDTVTGALGDTVTLRAALRRTTDDSPLAGRTIVFRVESTEAGSATTNAQGVGVVDFEIPLAMGAGDRTITVQFDGDTNHLVCTAYGLLTVQKRPTAVTVFDRAGQIGAQVSLSAALTCRGTAIDARTLAFSVAGTLVGTAETNLAGNATLAYVVAEAVGVGDSIVASEFAGDGIYGSSVGSGLLTVNRTGTMMYVPAYARTGAIGESVVIRGYLYRLTDRGPVVGRDVQFAVAGTVVDTQPTNADGRATGGYIIPSNAQSGDYTVTCTFAGDTTYEASSASGVLSLQVYKAATTLWVLQRVGWQGMQIYLRAYLRRALDGSWLPGKTVRLSVDGTLIGSETTDLDGRASVLYTIPAAMQYGDHVINATFAGNDEYLGCTADGVLTVIW